MFTPTNLLIQGKLPTIAPSQSILNSAKQFIPQDPFNPLPLTWKEASHLPGRNGDVFNQILWACTVMDAVKAHRKQHGLENPDEPLTAGEVDTFGNGPQVELTGEEEINTPLNENDVFLQSYKLGAIEYQMRRILESIYSELKDQLDISGAEDLTDEALQEWVAAHEHSPEYHAMRDHILEHLDHEKEFGLANVVLANHFVNRVAELAARSGKGLSGLQALREGVLGRAFKSQLHLFSAFAHHLMDVAQQGLNNIGVSVAHSITPTPMTPSFQQQLNRKLAGIGAPDISRTVDNVDPSHRLNQVRLAAVRSMYPNIPQSPAEQNKSLDVAAHAHKTLAPKPEPHSPEAVIAELVHCAKALGVGIVTLGKAIDKTLIQTFWVNDLMTQEALKKSPLVEAQAPKQSLMGKMMKDAMKPHHQ